MGDLKRYCMRYLIKQSPDLFVGTQADYLNQYPNQEDIQKGLDNTIRGNGYTFLPAHPDTTFCHGETINLLGKISHINASWGWTKGTVADTDVITPVYITNEKQLSDLAENFGTEADTIRYFFVVTRDSCGVSVKSFTYQNVIVRPLPTRTIDKTICQGETYDFYGTPFTANVTGHEYRFANASGCDSIVTLNLTVSSILTRTVDKTICQGETYDFYGTPFTANVTGYEYRFANANECDSIVTLNLIVNPSPIVTTNIISHQNCNTLGSAIADASGSTSPYSYSWSSGDVGNSVSDLLSGTYTVTVTDNNNCTGTDNILIIDEGTSIKIEAVNPPLQLCDGQTEHLTVKFVDGHNSNSTYNYVWKKDGDIVKEESLQGDTHIYENAPAGMYEVTVTDENGCSDTHPFNIANSPLNQLTTTTDYKEVCADSQFELEITSSNSDGNINYQWQQYSGNVWTNIPESSSVLVVANGLKNDMKYRVYSGCSDTVEIDVKVWGKTEIVNLIFFNQNDEQIDKLRLFPGQEITAAADVTNPDGTNFRYIWKVDGREVQNSSDKKYTQRYYDDTEIKVDVIVIVDSKECSVVLPPNNPQMIETVWPTAFTPYTPNEDSENRNFLLYIDCNMTIFNRYGQKVFEGKNGWDGKYRGQYADPGTYFYFVNLPDGKTKRGSIEIVNFIKQ